MSNRLKNGVCIKNIKPEMIQCDVIIQSIFNREGFECITTSANDGRHSERSLHYAGYAKDYRTKHIQHIDKKKKIAQRIRDALPCCDVVLEDIGEANEHLHVEYDPKDDPDFVFNKARYRAGEINDF